MKCPICKGSKIVIDPRIGDNMKCPICDGTGVLPDIQRRETIAEMRKKASWILADMGYGVREIQRLLKLKSPRSVTLYLKEKKDKNI